MLLPVKLEQIANYLRDYKSGYPTASLYLGKSGDTLFRFVYTKIDRKDEDVTLKENIDEIIKSIEEADDPNFTFCTGITGSLWLMKFLQRKKAISVESDFLDDIYPVLFSEANAFLDSNNYDFLHGAGGIILTLLQDAEKNRYQLEYLTKRLLQIRVLYRGCKVWQYYARKDGNGTFEVSIGLSHGLPAMMVLLSKLYAANILKYECAEAINDCYAFLKFIKNPKPDKENYSFYPTFVKDGEDLQYKSRLGWCYGDLSVGAGLYVVGKNIDSIEMQKEAEHIYLYYATVKNDKNEYAITDSCLCHGTAGLAHLFHRMYINTNNQKLKETAGYWVVLSLRAAYHPDGDLGYKYHFAEQGWQNNISLLNGLCGVGLTLSSYYLNEDPDWDECFLLS